MLEIKNTNRGNSLAVQWLGLRASTSGGTGLIPGQGTSCMAQPKKTKRILKNPKAKRTKTEKKRKHNKISNNYGTTTIGITHV